MNPEPCPQVSQGRYSHRFYTKGRQLYERAAVPSATGTGGGSRSSGGGGGGSAGDGGGTTPGGTTAPSEQYEVLVPKRTSMRHRIPDADPGLLDFIGHLLCVDPHK